MATQRTLELTLISAKDLKDVNFFTRLEIYAVAGLSNDPSTVHRTPTDREGLHNPTWNTTFHFPIPVGTDTARLILNVLLRAEGRVTDCDVGEVHVQVSDLEAGVGNRPQQFVSYQVMRPSGRGKGVLNFSYKFVEPAAPEIKTDAEVPVTHVTAYPVHPQPYPYPAPHGYPGYYNPAPVAGGYGYVQQPPAGYGYGYGYAAYPTVQPQKNGFGMGLGAGLLGGALGGLLIGDLVSDAGANYDGGFGDGFGF